jgi:hypothetical protein
MQTVECKGKDCTMQVIWLKTKSGKNMCIDADSYNGESMYVHGVHRPHWGSCPNAGDFRRRKGARH